MSQGPLCPNLTRKVQKEVPQIANHNLPVVMLLGGLSVNLNHLKMTQIHRNQSDLVKNILIYYYFNRTLIIET